jgi:hypothetical protein
MLRDVFDKHAELKGFNHYVCWSDGGPNLKNTKLYGSLGYQFLKDIGVPKQPHAWSITFRIFGPHHGKCAETDGHYSTLGHQFRNAALERPLVDVSDVVNVHNEAFALEARQASHKTTQHVYELTPGEKADVPMKRVTAKCMGGVRHNFQFQFKRLDIRRVNWLKTSDARIVSGLSLRTSTTSADHWKHEVHPVLRPVDAPRPPAAPGALAAGAPPAVALDAAALPPAAEADVEEDPEEEQLPLELLRSTKEWKGWRVSYCKLESDAVQAERFRKHLSKLSASVGDPADAQRYKTVEHKNRARLKTKQLVSERSKARSSFLRLKRAA